VSVKHDLLYSLIIIKLATCFDPIGSSAGLLYKPVNVKRLRTSLGCVQLIGKKFVSNWTQTFYIYLL